MKTMKKEILNETRVSSERSSERKVSGRLSKGRENVPVAPEEIFTFDVVVPVADGSFFISFPVTPEGVASNPPGVAVPVSLEGIVAAEPVAVVGVTRLDRERFFPDDLNEEINLTFMFLESLEGIRCLTFLLKLVPKWKNLT